MNATTVVDQLIEDYLTRLEHAAADLSPDRRAELLMEIREHMAAARAAGAAEDEATIRTLLDRLGEPEEIVAAAREGQEISGTEPPTPSSRDTTRSNLRAEIAAAVLLTVGSFALLIGWVVGLVLLWHSRRWRLAEKLLGTFVVPGGPAVLLWREAIVSRLECAGGPFPLPTELETLCTSFPTWTDLPLVLITLIVPFGVAAVLLVRARGRTVPAPAPPAARSVEWGRAEIATVLLLGLVGPFTIATLLMTWSLIDPVIPIGTLALFPAGTLVGLACLGAATQWSLREKVIGTTLTIVPTSLGVLGLFAPSSLMEINFTAVAAFALSVALGPVLAAGYLAVIRSSRS